MTDILWGQILTSAGAKTVIKTSGSCATDVENEVNLGLYVLVVLWLSLSVRCIHCAFTRYLHNHPRKNVRWDAASYLCCWLEVKASGSMLPAENPQPWRFVASCFCWVPFPSQMKRLRERWNHMDSCETCCVVFVWTPGHRPTYEQQMNWTMSVRFWVIWRKRS